MKKAELLASKNVPDLIKAIIASAPDDADIDVINLDMQKPTAKKQEEGCSCGACKCEEQSTDGVDVSVFIKALVCYVDSVIDLADDNGRMRREDADKLVYISNMMGDVFNRMGEHLAEN